MVYLCFQLLVSQYFKISCGLFSDLINYLILILPFIGAIILKLLVEPALVDRAPVLMRPRRQFIFDMALYLLIAIGFFSIQHLGYMV